tara:strand:- start:570 stop:1751 length:1182 start_codon:yes stop_codon:yes gene_type:complete
MSEVDLDELRAELNDFAVPKKDAARSPREERMIAGFEEIQRFVDEHGRAPSHGEDKDIFERLYAVRLDQIRRQDECRTLVADIDHHGLLDAPGVKAELEPEEIDIDELAAELGGLSEGDDDLTQLKHVKSRAEKRAAEEIANRTVCEDFDKFKPLFIQVQKELDRGMRETRPFQRMAEIKKGEFFIVGGQKAYVAEVGEDFRTEYDRRDSRLRVIYDNGTESDVLLRSLQRALHRDETGRRITDPKAGPLFAGEASEGDVETGTIYVLRSKSDLPFIAENREVIHKIGVTGGKVETRLTNAKLDPTFLMAEVEVIAEYDLYNINRSKLENLLHRFFGGARLDVQIDDRFGNPVKPREWFLVPLSVIDEVVAKIQEGTIAEYEYDPKTAQLKRC